MDSFPLCIRIRIPNLQRGILGDKGGSVTGYGRTQQRYYDLAKKFHVLLLIRLTFNSRRNLYGCLSSRTIHVAFLFHKKTIWKKQKQKQKHSFKFLVTKCKFITPWNISESTKYIFILFDYSKRVIFPVTPLMKYEVVSTMLGGTIAYFPVRDISNGGS